MDLFERLFAANQRYAGSFQEAGLATRPALGLAVLCCMDSRIDLSAVLGLRNGDAHIVRNAGGLVTEDAIRSLAISRWVLGTEAILVVQHTRCGLKALDEEALRDRIRADGGGEPPAAFGAFHDEHSSVAGGVAKLRSNPLFTGAEVRGAVYDVDTGRLREIAP